MVATQEHTDAVSALSILQRAINQLRAQAIADAATRPEIADFATGMAAAFGLVQQIIADATAPTPF